MYVCVCVSMNHTELSVLAPAHWLRVCRGSPVELSRPRAMRYLGRLRLFTKSIGLIVSVEAQLLAGRPTYTHNTEHRHRSSKGTVYVCSGVSPASKSTLCTHVCQHIDQGDVCIRKEEGCIEWRKVLLIGTRINKYKNI